MGIDMAGYSGDNALMGTKHGSNNGGVGLCAAHQKMDINGIAAAELFDQSCCLLTVDILSIARCLLHVGFQHSL